jgi:hypothetical protein
VIILHIRKGYFHWHDKFITSIKLLLKNGKFLDHNFALAPLKHNTAITKPKLILSEDDVPTNFTHLGQYAFTSGNRIFKRKKNWKEDNARKPHCNNQNNEELLRDPIIYFTISIAFDIPPCTLINGIKT